MRWGNAVLAGGVAGVVEIENTVYVLPGSLDSQLLRPAAAGNIDPASVRDVKESSLYSLDCDFSQLDFVQPVLHPQKILCLGLNYRDHAAEVGADTPAFPTVFSKYANAMIGPREEILLPEESTKIDWEAELALVVGKKARRVSGQEAMEYILGFTVLNDVSVRDWQGRTSRWFQGKNWDATTPFGPCIVSADQLELQRGLRISCRVDGQLRQQGTTADMIFSPAQVLSYVSRFMTLLPADIIALGTPAGVGLSLRPRQWLEPGQLLETEIEGIGKLRNRCTCC